VARLTFALRHPIIPSQIYPPSRLHTLGHYYDFGRANQQPIASKQQKKISTTLKGSQKLSDQHDLFVTAVQAVGSLNA